MDNKKERDFSHPNFEFCILNFAFYKPQSPGLFCAFTLSAIAGFRLRKNLKPERFSISATEVAAVEIFTSFDDSLFSNKKPMQISSSAEVISLIALRVLPDLVRNNSL